MLTIKILCCVSEDNCTGFTLLLAASFNGQFIDYFSIPVARLNSEAICTSAAEILRRIYPQLRLQEKEYAFVCGRDFCFECVE